MKKYIPNTLTLLNLFCGIIALTVSFSAPVEWVFFWVFLAIIFDFFDGFAARALRVTSPLGLQLDSLADMVTSGVVPGLMMFFMLKESHFSILPVGENIFLKYLPWVGFAITLASAYRLAKFNIDTRQSHGFIGLPTPANALFIISLAYLSSQYGVLQSTELLLGITVFSSWILNAEIPLFALKFKSFGWKENAIRYIFVVFSAVLFLIFKIVAFPFIIGLYLFLSVIQKR